MQMPGALEEKKEDVKREQKKRESTRGGWGPRKKNVLDRLVPSRNERRHIKNNKEEGQTSTRKGRGDGGGVREGLKGERAPSAGMSH